MKRRNFLKAILAVPVAGLAVVKVTEPIGPLAQLRWQALLERHHANLFPTLGAVTDEELDGLFEEPIEVVKLWT